MKLLKVPIPPDMDKFAIFYKRNMSTYYDGVFNLITGSLNSKKANQMYSWNFTNETPYFPDKCGKVWGNGELFKPFLPKATGKLKTRYKYFKSFTTSFPFTKSQI